MPPGIEAEVLAHQPEDQVVGHQLPGVHVALGLPSELGALPARGPEQVARRDVDRPGVVREADGLGALTDARSAQENHDHRLHSR